MSIEKRAGETRDKETRGNELPKSVTGFLNLA